MPMGYAGSCALLQLEHLAQPIDDVVDPARVVVNYAAIGPNMGAYLAGGRSTL